MKRSRKIAVGGVVLGVGAVVAYMATVNGASVTIDPSRLATVGARHDDPLGGGHRQDRADHQGRDQVEGQRHHRAAGRGRRITASRPARSWPSSTRRTSTPGCAKRAPTSRRPGRRCTAAEAQAGKNEIEAEAPDVAFAKSMYDRAISLSDQKLISQEALDQARTDYDQAMNRQRAAQSQLLVSRAKIEEARAQVAQAQAAVERAEEELRQLDHQGADPRHGADPRRRDRQPGVVDPQPRRQRHPGDDAGRHPAGVRARQGRRGRHRPACGSGMPARITTESFRDKVFTARSRRSRRSASRRTTSPPSRSRCRSTTPGRS